jgi:hypothetical protein
MSGGLDLSERGGLPLFTQLPRRSLLGNSAGIKTEPQNSAALLGGSEFNERRCVLSLDVNDLPRILVYAELDIVAIFDQAPQVAHTYRIQPFVIVAVVEEAVVEEALII